MQPIDTHDVSEKVSGHEFYTPIPKDYKTGETKFVIVTGSVMSGIGKGTFTGCLATLLSFEGMKVSPVKFDGYLNYDAGTLNPYRHGEVFVLSDGTEGDLDLGSYERYLNRDITKDNYLTGGKIFKTIIDKERAGGYLGRDVQFIPHVTGEIKNFLRELAVKENADIVLVEVGGTVGDLENAYFVEAMRELRYEEGRNNVLFVNVTYIIEPKTLGEFKSKAAQIGIRQLMGLGVQPDIIICRSEHPVTQKIREKLSIFSDVPLERVYNLYDIKNVYEIPLKLKEMGIDKSIFKILDTSPKPNKDKVLNARNWNEFVKKMKEAKHEVTIAIVGKYTHVKDSYLSVEKAIEHAGPYAGVKPKIKWVEATDVEEGKVRLSELFQGVDGLIVPIGFGSRGAEGKIAAIKYARENNIPFLGLCYGLQMAVVEFARNVCGLKAANSTEINPKTKYPVIDIIPEQEEKLKKSEIGGTMRLGNYPAKLKKGSLLHKLYGKDLVHERHRHRFEVNPVFHKILEKNGMVLSGIWPKRNLVEFIELPSHKYFVASQSHPELRSRPLRPSPPFVGFLKACV